MTRVMRSALPTVGLALLALALPAFSAGPPAAGKPAKKARPSDTSTPLARAVATTSAESTPSRSRSHTKKPPVGSSNDHGPSRKVSLSATRRVQTRRRIWRSSASSLPNPS